MNNEELIQEFEMIGKTFFNVGKMLGALEREILKLEGRIGKIEKSIINDT